MDIGTVQKLTDIGRRLDTQELPEKSSDLISPFLALPPLRAFWPMSAVDYTNPQAKDLGGGGHHLTNNNVATFGYDPNRVLVPCIFLNGTTQYLSRADGGAANWADIVGTEAYILATQRGLTLGGWFWTDTFSGLDGFMAKGGAVIANLSYSMFLRNAAPFTTLRCEIYSGGVASTVDATVTMSASAWHFLAFRYKPSTEIKSWVNSSTATNVVAIPASITDSTGAFEVGRFLNNNANALDGRASLCFLCAAALSDAAISSLFQQTRGAFGV